MRLFARIDLNIEFWSPVGFFEFFGKRFGKDMVRGVVMDVTQEPAVVNAIAETVQAFGGLDIVVNNAGTSKAGPFEKIEPLAVTSSRTNWSNGLLVRNDSRSQLCRAHIPCAPSERLEFRTRSDQRSDQ